MHTFWNSFLAQLNRLTLRLTPRRAVGDGNDTYADELLIHIGLVTTVFALVYVAVSFVVSYYIGIVLMLICCGLLVATLALFRITGRFRLCANLYLANCFFVAIFGCSLYTGGIHSMVLPWFALIPISSVLLLGLGTDTILWTLLSCIAVAGFGVVGILGKTPAISYDADSTNFFNLTCIVGLVLILSWIAFLFGNNRKSAMATIVDQKHSLEQALTEIEHLAFYDALTQIPNRRLFGDRLRHALTEVRCCGSHGALMFMDLDNFKLLNDSHGHEAGDLLLAEVAKRLAGCIREADTVARFGGDEFAVILHGLSAERAIAETSATHIAEKIATALAEPYILTVRKDKGVDRIIRHQSSASIGVVLFRDETASQKELLDRADAAMYKAKAAGRNTIHFYHPEDLLNGDSAHQGGAAA